MGVIRLGGCFESLERGDGGVSETDKGADQLVEEANGNKEESQKETRQKNVGRVDASFAGEKIKGEQITELRFEVSLETEITARQVVNKWVVGGRDRVSTSCMRRGRRRGSGFGRSGGLHRRGNGGDW